ncbi:hypothetical protein CLS_20770 [[Clostridium] cf. saccharolyticum K10]|nr:hypothetical protein CLS_20770 [[Clostridium] cf. saccharolyticum K10]
MSYGRLLQSLFYDSDSVNQSLFSSSPVRTAA